MPLLLFLSALLSALTGAISGVRAPETQFHQQSATIERAEAAASSTRIAANVVRSWLALVRVRQTVVTVREAGTAFDLAATVPLYFGRLRA